MPVMKQVKVVWPESFHHFVSEILDISLSGIAIPRAPVLSKIKLGQSFDLNLKLEREGGSVARSVPLRSRVVRMTAKMVGLTFESISTEGRLALDQATKDLLVQKHLREFSTAELAPQLQSDLWVHGPFDTNIFIWFKEDGSLRQAVIEYDHLLWIYQDGKISLERSVSSAEEGGVI